MSPHILAFWNFWHPSHHSIMARFDSQESHGIRFPGQILDQIRSKEESGEYKDARFGGNRRKKSHKPVSRKDKRKEERRLKKQKRLNHHEPEQHQQVDRRQNTGSGNGNKNPKTLAEDPLAALAALKAKKNKKPSERKVKEVVLSESEDFGDFDDEDLDEQDNEDPMEQLRALKAKRKGSLDVRIVKEDDFEDEELSEDLDEEMSEDFEGFDEESGDDDEEKEEDPMEALRKLKAGKTQNSEMRVVKEDALEDELDLEDLEGLDEDDDDLRYDDEDEYNEEVDQDDFDEEFDDFEEEEDPLAKLKALKEAKNGKNPKKEKVIEASFVDPFENDMEFYAKKLGLKDGKKSKLAKADDDDSIGGLLDGLDFDYLDGPEAESEEEGTEEFEDEEDESDHPKENPFVAPTVESSEPDEGSGSRYIPPALRRKLALEKSEVSAEVLALQKSIKGPINKLSETNVGSIVNEINGLFLNNPRQLVTENLTSIILESVIQQGRLLDTFVYLHAVLVAAIYRLQGVDFGAYFVQTLIERYEKLKVDPLKMKESINIISSLSSVYAFQLVSSRLLYDIIKVLIDELSESNAELLLKIIRTSGNQMRSDDPTALKEIVLQVTKKSASMSLSAVSTRMQFLIETIASLKNNKLKDVNESTHQLTIRLKKFLGNFASSKAVDPLQVSLDDIHNIDTKGKWWLVGSAWKGDDGAVKSELVNSEVMNDILDSADVNWIELARAQRMNTDIRRAIFISIMSANDYIDAVTKLDKLALRKSQEREIPRIVIHCAVVEPAWNPYYGILAAKLCDSHSYRKTFQFMLWDLIKGFEGASGNDSDEEEDVFSGFDDSRDEDDKLKKILNLGRFFGYLFAEGSLALHMLRTVNFVTASADNKLFMEILFVTFLDQIGKKSQVNAIGVGLVGKKKMSEQKFDDKTLIERLLKAKEQPVLLKGIQHFIDKRLRSSDFITGRKQRKRIEWGIGAMGDIIDEFVKEYDF